MVAQARKWSDLTEREKAMVIGGFAMVATLIIAIIVYNQFFIAEDSFHIRSVMNSGAYLNAVELVILSVFLVVGLPSVVVGFTTATFLAKRSISLALKDILFALAGLGALCLMIVVLLAFFGMVFSDASQQVQLIFGTFAFIIPMVVGIRILTLKKVLRYLRRLEDQNKI